MGDEMKILELFCGTKSFSNVAKDMGHQVITLDSNPQFNPNICENIIDFDYIFNNIDIVWASPPCQCFSVATIGRNWNKDYTPKTKGAELAMQLVLKTLVIINDLQPTYYFIENPRSMLRKMWFMKGYNRNTITYCQYGDTRMKPTDIWTNCDLWKPRPMCKNGDKCHISAPRGSRMGTQGLKNSTERGRVPEQLCKEILECINL